MEFFPTPRPVLKKLVVLGAAVAVLGGSGCSSVAPSRTATGAGAGAAIGGVGGAVVGNNSSLGTGTGAAIGAVAGALTGGIIGMVQDAKDRKEQDRLAQERAYQQELARKRSAEAKMKAESDEEIAIAQGFRISDIELTDAQKKKENADERLKKLRDERAGALAKKKALDDAHDKTLQTEAEIARLEEELARLKGETLVPKAPAAPKL
jgi:uncharacterized protein YcfJ